MTVPADTLHALRRGDLAGARVLRLPPGLAAVPPEVFGLADTLELLDIGGSTLGDLPHDLPRLRNLRVLFCSGGRFVRLPPVLGDCPALEQVGCRGAGVREVPAEALPPRLRWLTLTDNAIETLPAALGERPMLQKLMLSGNRLDALPDSLAGAPSLELLRVAANRFAAPPPWLGALPRLAWLACAGNPFEPHLPPARMPDVPWEDLEPGALLGEGASGRIHAARWRRPDAVREVAVKLFRGTMTSDGLPEREMAACLAAGAHPNLTGGLGRLVGHPEGADGLLMPLLPAGWRALAGPPSLASCSRDVYDPALRLTPEVALRLARAAAAGAAHLHARGLMHGDLYAHNLLWDGASGAAVLSDFGAACALAAGETGDAFRRVEVRAWGLLLGEILDRCDPVPAEMAALRALERACVQPDVGARPLMAEVVEALDRVGTPEAG
ncbi:hypothetical protein BHAOGJBA_0480 [Methylobacterium hispanicum]|jgi:hypothetical protein|uniref:Protein kinase domain-containing protein n=1 Tax=Methylobacterium hispanicum TaxID=270350 RepID=A0AAV4ZGJ7_9HYPH|nr:MULTISPECIES: leucine-rich repeat-containing protein kinase family protein [Methylobacterium]GJD86981.1 hypothetical protein BHAOGJBA_0480 [Methylobacterium hispanicum]